MQSISVVDKCDFLHEKEVTGLSVTCNGFHRLDLYNKGHGRTQRTAGGRNG
jgi:hypothetical protein